MKWKYSFLPSFSGIFIFGTYFWQVDHKQENSAERLPPAIFGMLGDIVDSEKGVESMR